MKTVRHRHHIDGPGRPITVEWHVLGCDCPACEPYRPSVPRPLGARQIAALTVDGLFLGLLIAVLLFGPAAVLRAAWACVAVVL